MNSKTESDEIIEGGTFNAEVPFVFKLKHGQTIRFKELPESTEFTVTEKKENEYVTSGEITAKDPVKSNGEFKGQIDWKSKDDNGARVDVVNIKGYEHTYKLIFEKENENGEKLQGAQFRLYKDDERTPIHLVKIDKHKGAYRLANADEEGIIDIESEENEITGTIIIFELIDFNSFIVL